MTLDATLFAALAPEFVGTSPAVLTAVSAEAERFVPPDVWGSKAALGLVYYTAHLLKQAKDSAANAAGQTVLTKVGDLERRFAAPVKSAGASDLEDTIYGQRYLGIRRTLQISPFVVS
jgi:hypothetical protein